MIAMIILVSAAVGAAVALLVYHLLNKETLHETQENKKAS